MVRALIIDDAPSIRAGATKLLDGWGFSTQSAESVATARSALTGGEAFDVALVDIHLPDGLGTDLLPVLKEQGTRVIVITGQGDLETAVDAFRSGVVDYLTKPVDTTRLKELLEPYKAQPGLPADPKQVERSADGLGPMVGRSPKMQTVYRLIEQVAPTDANVFVVGETGTGKELVAKTVHDLSRRARGPYVAVNCGAIPAELMESELFGHERGSFTGAHRQHAGVFERANSGTLFLDEVSEMPSALQVKLLRVLEDRIVTRIGGQTPFGVDVRLIAATNRDPGAAVAGGLVREDLLHRLWVFPIVLPPLRERGDDVVLLAQKFLEELNRESGESRAFDGNALQQLKKLRWEGNVRELRNLVRRLHILARDVIAAELVPEGGLDGSSPHAGVGSVTLPIGASWADAEKQLILGTLEHFEGNKPKAAAALGISLKTLYNRLKVYRG